MKHPEIPDFTHFVATHQQRSISVYCSGQGPTIVILPEIPGLHQQVFKLARRITAAGFQVFLPALFGKVNAPFRSIDAAYEVARVCIRREFFLFASQKTSPMMNWVRDFCTDLHHQHGGQGIGLIGMCITGNFALSLLAEPWMLAPVLSQPSLPFGFRKQKTAALHVCPKLLKKGKERSDLQILGLRFSEDIFCRPPRFARLHQEFGERFTGIEIDSRPGNPYGIPPQAHSVLAVDFVDEEGHPTYSALQQTLDFFRQRLLDTTKTEASGNPHDTPNRE